MIASARMSAAELDAVERGPLGPWLPWSGEPRARALALAWALPLYGYGALSLIAAKAARAGAMAFSRNSASASRPAFRWCTARFSRASGSPTCSTACAAFDTDLIAHQLTAPGGRAMPAIRDAFGAAYLTPDGALDRAATGRPRP